MIVNTDSKFVEVAAKRFIPIWRNNDYRKVDGNPVKNREDLEELDRLLQSIQVFYFIKYFQQLFFTLGDI